MPTINDLMAALGKGKANAIHAADLARLLGLSPEPNQEDLRELIRQAIDQGALIGSSKIGYWEIDSLDELNTVLDSHEGRAQGVCNRRNALLNTWNSLHPNNKTDRLQKNIN